MSQPLTLVIDQGTHATRALAFDEDGRVRASAYRQIGLQRHDAARIEQDGTEIIASLHEVIEAVLADPIVRRLDIAQAGLTGQRSSVIAWDRRTGEPLAPLLSWQDRRVADWLQAFNHHAPAIKARTGLRLSPHYGAGKFRWYLDHVEAVASSYRRGYLALGPEAGFLLYHLLANRPLVVDHVDAARTQLWDLETLDWDPWLLDLFNIPLETLPQCRPVLHPYGRLTMADIPLTAVNGDQNSAIYSLGRPRRDTAIINLGTGAFILHLTGSKLIHHADLLVGLASSSARRTEYLLEGTVNGAGSAISWAANAWNLPNITENLPTWLAQAKNPPIFLNTIGGLGSPWWQPDRLPRLIEAGEPWQNAVALAESIVFLLQVNLETMLAAGQEIKRIQVSGGLARLDHLCQRLADLSQRPVYRPVETEATARGIAWLAAGQPKHWPRPGRGRVFHPRPNPPLLERYHRFFEALSNEPGDD